MSTVKPGEKPAWMKPEDLEKRPGLWISLAQPGGLALRLKNNGVTKHGFQLLFEHYGATVKFIQLINRDPVSVGNALYDLEQELNTKPPYGDWRLSDENVFEVIVDERFPHGPAVPDDFDLSTLTPTQVPSYGVFRMSEDWQRRAVEDLKAVYGRALLWWLLNHQDKIPEEWKELGYIDFAGDFDLRDNSDNSRIILQLYWYSGSWDWAPVCLDGDPHAVDIEDKVLAPIDK